MKNEEIIQKELSGWHDLKTLPEISEKDWQDFLAEEYKLRKQLKQGIVLFDKAPSQIAEEAKNQGLTEVLLRWAETHKRNRSYQIKLNKGDVLLMPATLDLLEAADIR